MAVVDPLFWFEVKYRKRTGRIYLATVEGHPELRDSSGICYRKEGLIYINVRETKHTQEVTVLHELQHLSCDGLKFVSHEAEERVIRHGDIPLFGLLRSVGLAWPPRPEGYEALKRRADRLYRLECAAAMGEKSVA